MLIIPTVNNGDRLYTQRTELDGVPYLLTFKHARRTGRWTLDITDADESPIVMGIIVVTNFMLGRWVLDERWIPGVLLTMDQEAATDQEAIDPSLRDLGARVLLAYADQANIDAVAAGA